MATLITTIGATGTLHPTAGVNYNAGEANLIFQGSFNSKTINVQASFDDGGTFIDLNDESGNPIAITQNSIILVNLGGCKLRFKTSAALGAGNEVQVRIA